jgi:hypothetical protein
MRNWKDYIAEAEEILSQEQNLDEKMLKKYYIDHGIKKAKLVTDKEGYRIQYDQNHQPREVRIPPMERKRRRLGALTGKLKHNKAREQGLRKKSFDKRDQAGLEYNKDLPELNARREEGEELKSDKKGWLKQKLQNLKDKLMKDIVKV